MSKEKKYYLHESSYVDDNVKIKSGTKIWHFSHIQNGARIGKNCSIGQNVNIGNNVKIGNYVKIQNNVSIYEGVEIEDYVFCGPSVVFTNVIRPRSEFPQRGSKFYSKTLIKKSASIGANSTIVCGNSIGRYAFIGAGTVVTKDVPDHALMVGNPGNIVGWVDKIGNRLKFNKEGSSLSGDYNLKGDILTKKDRS
jgi:UDP-2-acetamido-3-amino-2,3-dideoxy-glucuronate N-acetyltransferase